MVVVDIRGRLDITTEMLSGVFYSAARPSRLSNRDLLIVDWLPGTCTLWRCNAAVDQSTVDLEVLSEFSYTPPPLHASIRSNESEAYVETQKPV